MVNSDLPDVMPQPAFETINLPIYSYMAAAAPTPQITSANVVAFMTSTDMQNPYPFCRMQ